MSARIVANVIDRTEIRTVRLAPPTMNGPHSLMKAVSMLSGEPEAGEDYADEEAIQVAATFSRKAVRARSSAA